MIINILQSNLSTVDAFIWILAFVFAIMIAMSFHEYGHAYAAYKMGDDTAKQYGRLTLNPFAHFDTIGLLCFLFLGFGWAKPVPINPLRFNKYKTGVIRVSIAGVTVNLILCVISVFFYTMISSLLISTANIVTFLKVFFSYSAQINCFLIIFNLLPFYPLDGFNLLAANLKPNNKYLEFNYKYGYLILIMLLFTGILGTIITVVSNWILLPLENLFRLMF